MKILLLGKNGQVGWELQRSLAPLGELLALDRHSTDFCGDFCGDLNQPERLAQTVRDWRPDVIVNAAAHTAVDKAESEPELAYLVNARAPQAMARACQARGVPLIHVSTDMVFSGAGAGALVGAGAVEVTGAGASARATAGPAIIAPAATTVRQILEVTS